MPSGAPTKPVSLGPMFIRNSWEGARSHAPQPQFAISPEFLLNYFPPIKTRMRPSLHRIVALTLLALLPMQVWGMRAMWSCETASGEATVAVQAPPAHVHDGDDNGAETEPHHQLTGSQPASADGCGMCAACAMCFQAASCEGTTLPQPKPAGEVDDLTKLRLPPRFLEIPQPIPIASTALA